MSLQRARNAGEYQNVLSECLSIVDGMQTMVNSLLMIARLDANQTVFRREQVHPAELVNSCWRHFSEKAIERAIIFDNSIPEQMSCESDPDSLYMVLSNLLNNAVEYTNDAGQIWVTAHRTDNSVEITVANTGCKLTSNEAAQVFDCFWRGDLSRRDVGVHCGLGLALVERIIKALGGSATAQVQPGGIFSVRLALLV